MALAPEQTAWADDHVDVETTVAVTGNITSFDVNDNGSVTFHVDGATDKASFVAWPPSTADELAAKEQANAEAAAAADAASQAAAAAAQAAKDRAAAERAAKVDSIIEKLGLDDGPAEAFRELLT